MLAVAMLSFAHVHAEGYARQLQQNRRARLALVWDEDPDRGREAAARHGVPFEADLGRALAHPEVRGVICNAPSSLHADVLVAAARAGKHIFTEKVLAPTVAECDRILAAAREAAVHLVVSMPALCDPAMRWAKQAVDEGRLGRVTMVRTRIGHAAALDRWFRAGSSWFADVRQAGGGALMDLGCHPVYRIRHLLGEPRAVMARLTNFSGAYPIDDQGVVLLEFENGALGVVEASWVQRGGPEGMAIYGTEGWALIDHPGARVRCGGEAFTGAHGGELVPGKLPPPWRSPLEQWVDAVLDGTEPEIRPEWGRQLTEILQAAYISERERREVRWPVT
jgi:1,5-anhydro-D-fructose reductase (1,5-anhydro-D-mannitol-forming)